MNEYIMPSSFVASLYVAVLVLAVLQRTLLRLMLSIIAYRSVQLRASCTIEKRLRPSFVFSLVEAAFAVHGARGLP